MTTSVPALSGVTTLPEIPNPVILDLEPLTRLKDNCDISLRQRCSEDQIMGKEQNQKKETKKKPTKTQKEKKAAKAEKKKRST